MSSHRSLIINNGSLFFLFLLNLLFLSNGVFGSSGDRAEEFQRCVSHCSRTVCSLASSPPSLWSRLVHWTCVDECDYTCMHIITDFALQDSAQVHQYHGKWPFWRVAGVQEPASVLFSLLNLWGHIRGARTIRRALRADHPMKWYYLVWAGVCMNSWVWSAVFHTRGASFPLPSTMDRHH
jgi:post-GPI attachment to proteins factor 3